MIKATIFLGAGASKADGAPLQNELFRDYIISSNSMVHTEQYHNRKHKIRRNIKEFFKEFFGYENIFNSSIRIEFPTFEEALGILDLALSRNEEYKNNVNKLNNYRSSLVFSMAESIQYRLDIFNRSTREHHNNLIDNLNFQINDNEYSFISTNYDLLIDNAILSRSMKPNYMFDDISGESDVKVLKLHGSLNWLYCPVCNSICYTDYSKSMINAVLNPETNKCRACSSNQRFIIVPPTYFKDMSNHYLLQIWNQAEKELLQSDHIVFCGYSFPDADMHIKYLLKRAEINRLKESALKVTIINNYEKKNHDISQMEEQRYRRFFSQDTRIDFRYDMSFEQFARNPHEILNDD